MEKDWDKNVGNHSKLDIIKERLDRIQILLNKSKLGIVIIDQNHKVIESNQQFAKMLGYTTEEVLSLHTWDWEAKQKKEDIKKAYSDLSKVDFDIETVHKRKDGSKFDVQVTATGTKITSTDNKYNAVMCFCRDISERKQAQHELKKSEKRYRTYVENSADIIMIIDKAGLVEYMSPNSKEILGYSNEDIEGNKLDKYVNLKDEESFSKWIEKVYSKNKIPKKIQLKFIEASGRKRWYEIRFSLTKDEEENDIIICNMRNVDLRKKYEEKLRYLSLHDQLTGVYNRTHFEREINKIKKEDYPISIVVCDMDDLKMMNDEFGHAYGDLLIKTLCNILSKCIKETDLLARMGGDEFYVLLKETNKEEAEKFLDTVKNKLDEYNKSYKQDNLKIKASFGFATTNNLAESIEKGINIADARMYKNKREKKRAL